MAKRGLNIIIVGAGKIGRTLTSLLTEEGHNITVIDEDSSAVSDVSTKFNCMGIIGNGAKHSTLRDAGIMQADLFIAVTQSDELNLLCCTIAKQNNDDLATIARVRDPEYSEDATYLRDKLDLAMIINPELEAAREIARILYLPTALDIDTFAHGTAELIRIKIPEGSVADNKSLIALASKFRKSVLVVAVERGGDVFIPDGNFVLSAGDIISFVARRKDCINFLKSIGFNTKSVRDALIVGGGASSYYLTGELLHSGIDVKVIETSREKCLLLSDAFPQASYICGDGTNESLLDEAGLKDADAFVPLTGIDEKNIFLTLYAKENSDAKTVTKLKKITFGKIIDSLDLGSVVCPKDICSEIILSYVRARQASLDSNLESLYRLFGGKVEAMEFEVTEASAATGIPLKDLKLRDDVLISFIARGGEIIIPSGDDTIEPGDSVMVVTTTTGFTDLTDILR